MSETRKCSKCRETKPLSRYSSPTSGYCVICFRAYRLARYIKVDAAAGARRKSDPAWRKKHDRKVCNVCERTGSEKVIFRTLKRGRCSDCERRARFRCTRHGIVRNYKCKYCQRERNGRYRAAKRAAPLIAAKRSILVITGAGDCADCGTRIRIQGKIDRSHKCSTP